ncbi:hypothetical protein [Nocardioides sp. 503]|uniref:hypothetical protein n=1 Tax=Nocardioides sp. 503 TaxID=2508326 RepID=UPI0010702E90|nr:hypothetical protein [Nocardioides sp. 503]
MQKSSFEAHPIWASVHQLNDLLQQAEQKATAGSEPALVDLRYFVSLIKSHADPADAAPYSATALSAVNGNLPNITNELSNFIANDNVGHLTNAQTYADQVLQLLGAWPVAPLKGGAAAQANKIFTEYRDAAEEALSNIRDSNVALQDNLRDQQATHEAAVAALRVEIANLSTKITADEARLDVALTNNNEAFTTKQTEREEKFNEFVQEQGLALKHLAIKDLNAIQEAVQQADARYKEIDALREGTEKVAGLASADILAGKYKEYSDQQWRWGVGANILGFLTLALGVWLIVRTVSKVSADEDITWQYTGLKLGVTLTIVAASAVAFRLGGVFLSRSSSNKRMELELRAIGPFFADIDDEDAVRDAKKAFVERSFGQGGGGGKFMDSSHLSATDTASLLREIRELAKAVASKTP